MFGWFEKRKVREQARMVRMTEKALAFLEGNAMGAYSVAASEPISINSVPSGASAEIDEIRSCQALLALFASQVDIEDKTALGPAFWRKLYDIHMFTRRLYDTLPYSRIQPYDAHFTPPGGWKAWGL